MDRRRWWRPVETAAAQAAEVDPLEDDEPELEDELDEAEDVEELEEDSFAELPELEELSAEEVDPRESLR